MDHQEFERLYDSSIPSVFMKAEGYCVRVTELIARDTVLIECSPEGGFFAFLHPATLANQKSLREIIIANWPSCPECHKPL